MVAFISLCTERERRDLMALLFIRRRSPVCRRVKIRVGSTYRPNSWHLSHTHGATESWTVYIQEGLLCVYTDRLDFAQTDGSVTELMLAQCKVLGLLTSPRKRPGDFKSMIYFWLFFFRKNISHSMLILGEKLLITKKTMWRALRKVEVETNELNFDMS